MPYTTIGVEYAEIDSIPSDTPAWRCQNLYELWAPAQTRGEDLIIPGAAGVVANPRRKTVTKRSLAIAVFGSEDWEGDPYSDERVGLEANWFHLSTVWSPGGDERPVVLHLPSGATRSGSAHIERFEPVGRAPGWIAATLDLSLALGELSEVGS